VLYLAYTCTTLLTCHQAPLPKLEELSLDQKIGQLFMVANVSDEELNQQDAICTIVLFDNPYVPAQVKHIPALICAYKSEPDAHNMQLHKLSWAPCTRQVNYLLKFNTRSHPLTTCSTVRTRYCF